jgi:hypothetical protein
MSSGGIYHRREDVKSRKENSVNKIALSVVVIIGVLFLSSLVAQAQEANRKSEAAGPKIVELRLGNAIRDKQIAGEDSTFALNAKVYVWIKITGVAADSIVVSWKHAGKEHKTTLGIGGSPWRTWAYKTMSSAGDWTVTVTTKSGEMLKETSFTVK